jgi:hypothetical protein
MKYSQGNRARTTTETEQIMTKSYTKMQLRTPRACIKNYADGQKSKMRK